jgi:U3 small nucleolar RNA-associated protein 7
LKRVTLERERSLRAAAAAAAAAELLLPGAAGALEAEGPMERTYQFSQASVSAAVGAAGARRGASLALPLGPYRVAYTRSGRHMVLGGARGHLAVVDWNRFKLGAEFNVGEAVRDVCFFHNESLFAAAQQKYVHVYDHTGAEVHVLRGHQEPLALEFLPYHFLLASVGRGGFLKYQDVSTGALVAEHRTRLGPCGVLRQNPWNAVLCAGHAGGAVTLWTPNMSTPVATLAAHRGAVTALAVDPRGTYLVTAGGDGRVKVWDLRRWESRHIPVWVGEFGTVVGDTSVAWGWLMTYIADMHYAYWPLNGCAKPFETFRNDTYGILDCDWETVRNRNWSKTIFPG